MRAFFEKDTLLEAALIIFPSVLVLDDPVQIRIFLNLPPEPVNNPMFVTLRSVAMEINLMSQILLFGCRPGQYRSRKQEYHICPELTFFLEAKQIKKYN